MNVDVSNLIKRPYPSYKVPLEIARQWIRSKDSTQVQQAAQLLEGLIQRDKYKHVSSILRAELVLAYLELKKIDAVRAQLQQIDAAEIINNEEFRCRLGRLERDLAFEAINNGQLLEADNHLDRAVAHYQLGYLIDKGHYSGNNLAASLLYRSALANKQQKLDQAREYSDRARTVAQEVLDHSPQWKQLWPDDATIWHPATRGDALLILGRWEEAAFQYREALRGAGVMDFHRSSIRTQAKRLIDACVQLGNPPGPPFDQPERLFA